MLSAFGFKTTLILQSFNPKNPSQDNLSYKSWSRQCHIRFPLVEISWLNNPGKNSIMKPKENIPNWNDIIFEKKNKLYGAYELRTKYQKRLCFSLILSITISLIIFVFTYNSKKLNSDDLVYSTKENVEFSDDFIFEDEIKVEVEKEVAKNNSSQKPLENTYLPVSFDVDTIVDVDTTHITSTGNVDSVSTFNVASTSTGNSDTTTKSSTPVQYDFVTVAGVDKEPNFPGGIDKFISYIAKHVRYTEEAREARLSGRIFIRFIIDEKGELTDIKILRKLGFGLDEAVEKVLRRSPAWTPGFVRNSPVKTEMILPVSFSLAQ
jgi:protein TonB